MSWSDGHLRRGVLPRRAALSALLALASCGFAPVYAPGGAGAALHGRIAVGAPDSLAGYRMAERLEERLGRGPDAAYDLPVTLSVDSRAAALTARGIATRFALTGRADWQLLRRPDGAVVASGSVDAFSGYSASGTTVSTAAADEDAQERLGVMLADLIVTRLLTLDLP